MSSELARITAWWADAFANYRRIVLIAGGATPEIADQTMRVQRWEWLDDYQRIYAVEGMRAVSRIALDYQDVP